MNDNEIRNSVLEFAYNKAKEAGIIEGGRFTDHEISKLEGLEGIEKNRIDFNVDYLEKKGLIKWITTGRMTIAIWGIDYYERIHPEVLLVIPKESKMADNEIRDAILEAAYNKAKEASSIELGRFNVYEISKLEGIEKNRINFNADYLNKKGLVKWAAMGGNMAITVVGVDEYERMHKHE